MFTVVDTPGADAVGGVGEQEKDLALSASAEAGFPVWVFNAIQGMTITLLDILKSPGKRKPSQKGLRERITQSLESSPLAESRSVLDSESGE